jgi:hypothetical protein
MVITANGPLPALADVAVTASQAAGADLRRPRR